MTPKKEFQAAVKRKEKVQKKLISLTKKIKQLEEQKSSLEKQLLITYAECLQKSVLA